MKQAVIIMTALLIIPLSLTGCGKGYIGLNNRLDCNLFLLYMATERIDQYCSGFSDRSQKLCFKFIGLTELLYEERKCLLGAHPEKCEKPIKAFSNDAP